MTSPNWTPCTYLLLKSDLKIIGLIEFWDFSNNCSGVISKSRVAFLKNVLKNEIEVTSRI